jgi:uncharacterized protein with HEPN domain
MCARLRTPSLVSWCVVVSPYSGDLMLRSAVERQLAIVGEALNRRVIACRNVLIHGYERIDDAGVRRIVDADVPPPRRQAADLLAECGEP